MCVEITARRSRLSTRRDGESLAFRVALWLKERGTLRASDGLPKRDRRSRRFA
jgi:hypothetical protein